MTAVERFFKQLTEVDYGCINKTFLQNNNSLAGHKLRELLEQAKEMEKEQHQETWETAHQAGRFEGKGIAEENWQTFEAYWVETFKSE